VLSLEGLDLMAVVGTQTRTRSQAPWAYFTLCPFSQVAIRVMKLVNNEETPFNEISRLISSDPAFASEVLKISNSLWYAPRVPAVSIFQAVSRIGARNLQGLCLTVAMRSFLGDSMSRPVMRDMWRHNLACAFISEELAIYGGLDKEIAFTGGVLHDVGRLALAVLQPKEYVHLLGTHKGSAAGILTAERETFGFDHCDVGARLVSEWNLPAIFEAIVADHHSPRTCCHGWDTSDVVRLSCRMADAIGFPAFQGMETAPYDKLLEELPALDEDGGYPEQHVLATEVRAKIEAVEAI
jgi:putative nucleotidyltransferase with HDIG domain